MLALATEVDWNEVIESINVGVGNDAEASVDWTYPADNEAHTVTVSVNLLNGSEVKHMVEPVRLEVYRETKLLLWVERSDSSNHIFHGRLLTEDGVAVAGMPVKAYLNNTLLDESLVTNATGHFTFNRNFNPGEGRIAYTLQVSFEGTGNKTAMLNATDFMGGAYAVCQTMQFDYRPSANVTSIVVEPQVTEVTAPSKTPEEMQQEAEDEGLLQVWHEFTWWPPWYRLHIKISINPTIDVGFSPILPSGETFSWENLDLFAAIVEDIWEDIALDLIGVFAGYILAKGFSLWGNIPAAVLIEIGKGIAQGALLYLVWNDEMRVLATAIASILMGLIAIATNIGEWFVNTLMNMIAAPLRSAFYLISNKMIAVAAPFQFIRSPIDYLEAAIDFTIGVFAILRYLGRI